MFIAGVPVLQLTPPEIEVLAKAPRWESTKLVSCQVVLPGEDSAAATSGTNSLGPAAEVSFYFREWKRMDLGELINTAKVTLLSSPKHGELVLRDPRSHDFHYIPTEGFRGTERISFRVEIGGHRVLLEKLLIVSLAAGTGDIDDRLCPVPIREIKVQRSASPLFDWTYLLAYAGTSYAAPQFRVAALGHAGCVALAAWRHVGAVPACWCGAPEVLELAGSHQQPLHRRLNSRSGHEESIAAVCFARGNIEGRSHHHGRRAFERLDVMML